MRSKNLYRARPGAIVMISCLLLTALTSAGQDLLYDSIAANVFASDRFQVKGEVDCDNPQSTAAQYRCANLAFQESHRALEKEVAATVRYFVENGQAEQRFLFVNAQNQWMQYRNNHCSIYWRAYEGGSLQSIAFTSCLTEQTRQRLADVRELRKFLSIPGNP